MANELSRITKKLRVAVVHDWLTGYRGGEKVLEGILAHFPQAEIFTLVHKKGSVPESIERFPIHTSWIQHLPFGVSRYRHYLPLFPLAAESLLPPRFDLIISTSHAVAKSVRTGGRPHWCYIHSPMRYIWDRFGDYFGPDRVGGFLSRFFFRPITWALQWYDRATSKRVHHYVANSSFVAHRVQNIYGRPAEVISPPCSVESFFTIQREPRDFYLFFSALVPYKKADHAIKACIQAGRKLLVLGHGPELESLKALAGTHSQLISFQPHGTTAEVREALAQARALLFPGIEDFGIIPVEAIAAGLPVIGLAEGGLLDSMTDQTCLFYSQQTPEALAQAILDFEKGNKTFSIQILRDRATHFSEQVFREKIERSLLEFIQKQTHVT